LAVSGRETSSRGASPEPPRPRGFWRRIVALPGHIWRTSAEATVIFSEMLQRRPGKWKMRAIRAGILVAMKRQAEAIALLEANLDRDTWVGKFRSRLEELTWPRATSINSRRAAS
jgi:hypothetical protein